MNRKLRLVVSLLCFVATFGLVLMYADSVRAHERELKEETLAQFGGEVTRLVVCTRDLKAGDVVAPGDVALVDWISDLAPKSAFTSLDDVMGKTITAGAAKNTLLSGFNFNEASSFLDVPEGMVAISVPYSERLALPQDLKPNAKISAWVSTKQGSKLLSSEVVVLSLGEGSAKAGASRQVKHLTLAVKPDSVAMLLDASASAELRLVVPAADVANQSEDVYTSADTSSALASSANVPPVSDFAATVAATETPTTTEAPIEAESPAATTTSSN